MGTIIGFALGYYLGVKAGPGGFDELVDAWKSISGSQEMRDLLAGGASILRDMLKQGGSIMSERLSGTESPFPRAA